MWCVHKKGTEFILSDDESYIREVSRNLKGFPFEITGQFSMWRTNANEIVAGDDEVKYLFTTDGKQTQYKLSPGPGWKLLAVY